MPDNPFNKSVREIRSALQERGSLTVGEIEEVGVRNGVPEDRLKFLALHGLAKSRSWWAKEGDVLYPVEAPQSANGHQPASVGNTWLRPGCR